VRDSEQSDVIQRKTDESSTDFKIRSWTNLYESPNDLHSIGRNPSKTIPVKFLVFLIKDKDALVSIPVE
jgi:hypothetical protein